MITTYPDNYLITHIGDGRFTATFKDGSVKDVGPNLEGMIRYVYFEDFTIPEVGWTCGNSKLMEDYFPKVAKDVLDGKITKTSETDRIK